ERTDSTMIETLDHERTRSTTSAPSMSGRPRSMMTRSIGCSVAARIASAPLPASCTTNPLSSNPVRRKRRIWTSSSTTRTIGEGSLICVTFHLRSGYLPYRQFDRYGGSEICARADCVHFSAIGADEGVGDPKSQSGAVCCGGMTFAAHEAVPHLGPFARREPGALIADRYGHVAVHRARGNPDLRFAVRIFRGIVEYLHQRLLHQHRVDMHQRQVARNVEHDAAAAGTPAAALDCGMNDVGGVRPFGVRIESVAADA